MSRRHRSGRLAIGVGVCLALTSLACTFIIVGEGFGSARSPIWVHADEAWTDTGVDVEVGDLLSIEYVSGEWSPWPGASYDAIGFGGDPRCDCNVILGVSHAALIGRIGRGSPFLVGAGYSGAVGEPGRLFLGINDTRLEDNSGRIGVSIEVER
jgi:hypothetical protein